MKVEKTNLIGMKNGVEVLKFHAELLELFF